MRLLCFILAFAGLLLCADGCALRATTDFGPQSASTKQSVNGGLDGAPGIPFLGGGSSRAPADSGGSETGSTH